MKTITRISTRNNSAMTKMKQLIRNKVPFRYSLSSRTIVIHYNDVVEKFMQSTMNAKAFIAYSMIKKDLISKKIKIPRVASWQVKYYQHDISRTIREDQAYYIDIKSAYASILHNEGYISDRSYNYIMNLPKQDRLACVGMLASKKEWYSVDKNGNVKEEEQEVNELSGVFFYAVKRTYEIMDVCKMLIGSGNAVLNWVDCIYFREYTPGVTDAIAYLDQCGLDCHFNKISKFSTVVFKNKIRIRFKDSGKIKVFNLPIAKSYSAAIKVDMNGRIDNDNNRSLINNYKNKTK